MLNGPAPQAKRGPYASDKRRAGSFRVPRDRCRRRPINGEDKDVRKRWTICLVRGHGYDQVRYSPHGDTGFYRRCRRCVHEDHGGSSVMPTGAGM